MEYEVLEKKLELIEKAIDFFRGLMPQIQQPKIAGVPVPRQPKTSKVSTSSTGIKPPSAKNPVKVAEQISDPDKKDIQIKQAKEGLHFSSRGQWSLKHR